MKHGKRDGNHAEVRDALRRIPGCRVHDVGNGLCAMCALRHEEPSRDWAVRVIG